MLLPLAALIAVVPVVTGFVSVARNRLVAGWPVSLWDAASGLPPALGIAGLPPALGIAGLLPALGIAGAALLLAGAVGRRPSWALVGAAVISAGLSWVGGRYAAGVAISAPGSRVAFAAGFWLMQGGCVLVAVEAARRLGARGALLGVLLFAGPVGVLLQTGALSELSLLREYANKRDVIGPAFLRHIGIVTASVIPTLAIGVPLGVACHRFPRLAGGVFPALGLVQTIPSIALFGLLMAPLSSLAARFPALEQAGISGIGLAPAVIALVLYSLLPITRNTTAGLAGVPAAVRDAAIGLGMRPAQVFWQVDIRLALPALVAGLRVTLVQAVGLAAVAALIGAGGLGAIMFDGLFTGAVDLVLLGALPIIALAVAIDLLLRAAVPRAIPG